MQRRNVVNILRELDLICMILKIPNREIHLNGLRTKLHSVNLIKKIKKPFL